MALYFLKHSYNHVSNSVGSINGKLISKRSHRPLWEQEQLPQATKLPLGSATGKQINYHATPQLECSFLCKDDTVNISKYLMQKPWLAFTLLFITFSTVIFVFRQKIKISSGCVAAERNYCRTMDLTDILWFCMIAANVRFSNFCLNLFQDASSVCL